MFPRMRVVPPPLVRELAVDGIPVTVTCRVSEVHACALLPVARSSGDRGRAGLGVPRERVVRCAP